MLVLFKLVFIFRLVFAENYEQYLNGKLTQVQNDLKESFDRQFRSIEERSSIITFHENNALRQDNQITADWIFFNIAEHLFILENSNTILKVGRSLVDTNLYLENVTKLNVTGQVQFVEAETFQNTTFLIIGLKEGFCNIYTSDNLWNWSFRHGIQSAGVPEIAKFFQENNFLYLFIVNQKGTNLVPSMLYKWTQTYFDEIDRILMISGNGVTSLKTQGKTMLILLQNSLIFPKIGSMVFVIEKEKLKLTQHLDTNGPLTVVPYEYQNRKFVFILNRFGSNIIYLVKGLVLIKHFEFRPQILNPNVIYFPYSNNLLTIVHTSNGLSIYQIGNDQYTHVANLNGKFNRIKNMVITQSTNGTGTGQGQLTVFINEVHQIVVIPFEIRIELIEQPKVMAKVTTHMENLIDIQNMNLRKMHECLNRNTNNYLNLKRVTKQIQTNSMEIQQEIRLKLIEIQSRLDHFKSKHMFTNPNPNLRNNTHLKVHQKMKINGDVTIRTMNTHHINLKSINNVEWNPHRWLSQETSQNISCTAKIDTIYTNNLQLEPNLNHLFQNLLLQTTGPQHQHQTMTASMQFNNNLQAFHANVQIVNGVPFHKIVTSKNTNLLISGTKFFENLHANRLTIVNWNKLNIEDTPNKLDVDTVFISSDLKVTNNIEVTNINGLPFNKLMRSMFLRDVDQEIVGNLSFAVPFTATHIHTNSISNIRVADFMTTNTLQNVSTNIIFKSINTPNIHCGTVNGISLRENAAKTTEDNRIIGPVSTLQLILIGNSSLNGEFGPLDWMNDNGNHVIGTQESDLLQIYTEPVLIRGNLLLKNLQYSNKTRLNIHGNVWNTNFREKFWLKTINQEIVENVVFERGLTVPYVVVNKMNSVPTELFVNDTFNEHIWPMLPTQFYFKSLQVLGNLTLYPLFYTNMFHQSDVHAMAKQAVKLNGVYQISGPKIFKEKLFIKNLQVQYINDQPIFTTFNNISVPSIKIRGDLILTNTSSANINEISYPKSDDVSNIPKHLHMEQIQCKHIQIKNLNGQPLENLLRILNKEVALKKLVIHGNAVFDHLIAKQIQNFSMFNYGQIVQKNKTVFVTGHKTFKNLKIINLESTNLNGIVFDDMFTNVFSRKRSQTIRGKYNFTNIQAPSIRTQMIDGIQTKHLLLSTSNSNMQYLNTSLLKVRSAHVLGSLHPKLIHGLAVPDQIQDLQSIQAIHCNQLFVDGSIVMPDHSKVYSMLNNAIQSDHDYNITNPVNFKSRLLIKNLRSNRHINHINLSSIEKDALFRDHQNQKIYGNITFTNNLFANSIRVLNDSRIPFVNYWNITKFNEQIVRIEDVRPIIGGVKTFLNRVNAKHFQIDGQIHGIDPDVLVSYKRNRIIPSSLFQNLFVSNNFYVHNINQQNFTKFLDSRMLLSSKRRQHVWQPYQFENISLSGEADLASINDVLLENVITDSGIQNIATAKQFSKSIEIQTAVNIDVLNNVRIKDVYQNAIFTDESTFIHGNVMFENPVILNSKINANSLNGLTWNQLMDKIHIDMIHPEFATRIQTQLDNGIKLTQNMASRYLYLEQMAGVIDLPEMDMESGTVDYIQNTTQFNLFGERLNGNHCYLPINCTCATQYSFQFKHFGQIEPIYGADFQRIYQFTDNPNLIINVITNTISYQESCRSNSNTLDNEMSHIVWFEIIDPETQSRESHGDNVFEFDPDHVVGYLSDVKYFESHGEMYIVLARFYEPYNNTHTIDCLVLKLSKQTKKTTLIQTIETYGASTLDILVTEQGIILVIGNSQYIHDYSKRIDSGIYRFHDIEQQFQLLRNVSSRKAVTGISSANLKNGKSVITFAQSESSLAVYKYNRKFDNYYFYQLIHLESATLHANLFYLGETLKSDLFLTIVTNDSKFALYKYGYMEGFRLETEGELENVRILIPFLENHQMYLFGATTNKYAKIYKIVQQG